MATARDKLKEFLESKRMRKTQERVVILEEVMHVHKHFEPEDILVRLRRRGKRVSRASVYRTIALLVDAGIVRKTPCDKMGARYEHVFGHEHHDHLVCIECGRIIEFRNEGIEEAQKEIAGKYDFQMMAHRLVISGYCKECRDKQKAWRV